MPSKKSYKKKIGKTLTPKSNLKAKVGEEGGLWLFASSHPHFLLDSGYALCYFLVKSTFEKR